MCPALGQQWTSRSLFFQGTPQNRPLDGLYFYILWIADAQDLQRREGWGELGELGEFAWFPPAERPRQKGRSSLHFTFMDTLHAH